MKTKKIELGASVEFALRKIARHTDDLLSESALKTLLRVGDNAKKPKAISKRSEARFKMLISQLPEGIWTRVKHIIEFIETSNKRNNQASVTYSPLVSSYPEFDCCKIMKYRKGHIITGRDVEIEKTLLTLTKGSKRGVILVGEPGVGKAQPLSSKIKTPKGWTTMGQISIGSSIVCPDGSTATVDGVFPQGEKDVVELIFEDGRVADCCTEHLWKVYNKNWKRLGLSSRVIETKLLLKYLEKTKEKLYIDLPTPIEGQEKVPFSPYIMGTLLGDGSLTHGPQITNRNPHIHSKWKKEIIEGHSVNVIPSRNTFVCSITSNIRTPNIYRNFLKYYNLDCISTEKYIPYEFLESSVENKTKLLQGLMDTDGTVTKTGTLQYSTSSIKLKNDIEYLVRSLGGYAKSKEKQPKYKHNGEKREGKTSYTITIRIKDPHKYVTLPEKIKRIPKIYQYNDLKLRISSFRIKEREKCCCIYVNHKDHLYITDNFVVTHNTAIVNAINARLIERTVPRPLIGAQIINLDIPYVFTKYKDDPLGKIIKVLERASSYDKAILFIDEVHQLLGHKMNDVMKPYLTEKIRFIGSTTINEYHSIITDDVALERRFTVVSVPEPSITKTIGMVQGTKSVFEDEHKCTISDAVCEYAVVNGSRFLGHRRNPDKSLDLLDIACAIMNDHEIVSTYDKKPPTGDLIADLNNRRNEIDSMRDEPGNRVLSEHYINLAISSVTNIPFGEIKDSLDYAQVYATLKNKIFGQAEQLKKLANIVNIFKHVKYDRERPISVVLTVGPRGVGKKSAAAILAKSLYGRDDAFIEFNMSGMNSEFMITELKGAPPGYVGYGKSGGLIKKIRNNPQSVVYFKGMNKADNTILQYLFEACRHGKIVDSAEREASLNNTVIVFSVTLEDNEVEKVFGGKQKKMGFAKVEESDEGSVNFDSLKNVVGESLYNSVDEVIVFDQLGEDQLKMIYDANVDDLLNMYDVDIDLSDLQTTVIEGSKNGHDIISKLTSEVPKRVFQKLQKE